MFLAVLMETRNTFDSHIVRFCRSRGEDNIFGVSTDEISYFLKGSQCDMRYF